MGYSPWGHRESDKTERLSTHAHKPLKTNSHLTVIYYHLTVSMGQKWQPKEAVC